MRPVRLFALAAAAALLLAGCASAGGASPTSGAVLGEPFNYVTHCGVGAMNVDGTAYYPTGVFDGAEPVTGPGPSEYPSAGGPTPWFTVVDNTFVAAEGAGDPNQTFGTLERDDADGTAVFHVNGGRWSVHFSTKEADAAWVIEGCA